MVLAITSYVGQYPSGLRSMPFGHASVLRVPLLYRYVAFKMVSREEKKLHDVLH